MTNQADTKRTRALGYLVASVGALIVGLWLPLGPENTLSPVAGFLSWMSNLHWLARILIAPLVIVGVGGVVYGAGLLILKVSMYTTTKLLEVFGT